MNKKSIKTILLTTSLTLSISLTSLVNAYAATYTAVSGDSLYKISKIFNTTVAQLMSDNQLTTYNLNIGQKIFVPCKSYIVQKGDSLYLISQKFNISLYELRRANNIYTNYILVGQELNIPKTASGASTTSSAAPAVTAAPEVSPAPTVSAAPEVATVPVASAAPAVAAAPVATVAPEVATAPSYSASDLDLLSRLIMAEAQGQPYEAKVAVGAAVMNRVQSNLWPNSVSEVIYQNINGYYQFTPVENGWINNPADEDSIKAAKEAFNGADPTNGAMFYYDTSTTNPWMLAKPVSFTAGKMIFAY